MAASPDAVLHLAALHTLAHSGFASTSRAASLNLSAILARYLQLVAQECTERAALAGRSKVAAIDVVGSLEDLGMGGIEELQEWTAGLDKEVSFVGTKMEELESE
jgi:histone H3/H4